MYRLGALLRKIWKADIVRVFSLTSVATLVRMCTGLVSIKVVASVIGPAGVALMGQLNNFVAIVLSFAGAGITSGVTKYVAEYRDDSTAISRLLSTSLRITAGCSLVAGVAMIVLHRWLSTLVMLSADYGYVFVVFGLTVVLYAVNNLLISIVNGYKEFQRFVWISVANSVVGMVFTVVLVLCWGLRGAMISAVTYQSVMLGVTMWMLRRAGWLTRANFLGHCDRESLHRLLHFSLMALVTALCVPLVQMLLRGYVIDTLTATDAGWWEAMNRISNIYLMVITSSFGVYYLPRLSELADPRALRHEIFKAYKVILPVLVAGFVVIYLLRYFIIRVLYTEAFVPMENLFAWQMAADFFKIASWLLAYVMLAKAMTRVYIITEILSAAVFLALGYAFVNINGVVGLCQGYLVNYILYFLLMVVLARKIFFARG